jgi:hypothetical protein
MSKWRKTQDEMPPHIINVLVCVNNVVFPAFYNYKTDKWYSTYVKDELLNPPCWWMYLRDVERPTEE